MTTFGKRFVSRMITSPPTLFLIRGCESKRAVHFSVYEKNPEAVHNPVGVPDDVTQPDSDQYWAPHPQTGVFGPQATAGGENGSVDTVPEGSTLEEKAFIRPLEDLEKPPPQP